MVKVFRIFLSGLNILRIINEPTAAAIAYGLDKKVICYLLFNLILIFFIYDF